MRDTFRHSGRPRGSGVRQRPKGGRTWRDPTSGAGSRRGAKRVWLSVGRTLTQSPHALFADARRLVAKAGPNVGGDGCDFSVAEVKKTGHRSLEALAIPHRRCVRTQPDHLDQRRCWSVDDRAAAEGRLLPGGTLTFCQVASGALLAIDLGAELHRCFLRVVVAGGDCQSSQHATRDPKHTTACAALERSHREKNLRGWREPGRRCRARAERRVAGWCQSRAGWRSRRSGRAAGRAPNRRGSRRRSNRRRQSCRRP